jgi:putative nucleotidyltransferase with HDIG domain
MKSLSQERKNSLIVYSLVLLLSLLSTLFLLPLNFVNIPLLKPGEVSPVDIRSPVSVNAVDEEETERKRERVREKYLPIFSYRKRAYEEVLEKLNSLSYLTPEQKKLVRDVLNSYYKRGIISEVPKGFNEITVVAYGRRKKENPQNFLKVETIRKEFKKDLTKVLRDENLAERASEDLKIKPNYVFLKEESEKQWKEAESKVKPIYIKIRKGEVVVRKGEKVSPKASKELKLIRKEVLKNKTLNKYFSIFLLSLVSYLSVIRLYKLLSPSAYSLKNLIFSMSVITIDIFLIKFFTFLSKLIIETLNLPVNESLIYIPIVTSVIFGSMFINKKVALIHILPVTALSGFVISKPEFLIVPVSIGALFSAFDSRKFKSREVIYKSAFRGALVTVLLQEIFLIYYSGFNVRSENWIEPVLTIAGTLIAAVFVNGLSPLIISLFNFTTDYIYMELINLNHPLLRKLILKAPGTYSHSVMVATLAEAAAEAIGANALLAKAGGLFHDIGKLKNPQAFIENQFNGVNIHDKLPPEKSAAILRSHVEYGEELGRKYKLPKRIIDIIRQHHGTKLMKYFYHKAKELYGEDKVDEKVYRYPGPKPQFKESGIVMLADTVEAAVRSMKDKNIDLDSFIHKLIMDTIEEGQLNQSGLSLNEIGIIEKVFKKVLSGVYHSRIEYPEEKKE